MTNTNLHNSDIGSSIRFLSWNVKGMNSPVKRSRIFAHLKHLNIDKAFLQEAHLRDRDQVKLRCPWVGDIFHSTFNSKARGVAILVHKKIQFTVSKTVSDKNGQYLIIAGTLYHNPVLLVNIYAPNFDDPNFTDKLFGNLPFLNTHLLILGGDLNCVVDPSLDRSNPRTLTQSYMAKSISDFAQERVCRPLEVLQPSSQRIFLFFTCTPIIFSHWLFFCWQLSSSQSDFFWISSNCYLRSRPPNFRYKISWPAPLLFTLEA